MRKNLTANHYRQNDSIKKKKRSHLRKHLLSSTVQGENDKHTPMLGEICLCAAAAHGSSFPGRERNWNKEEISLWDVNTHYSPHLPPGSRSFLHILIVPIFKRLPSHLKVLICARTYF
jgi:hypothetical protein